MRTFRAPALILLLCGAAAGCGSVSDADRRALVGESLAIERICGEGKPGAARDRRIRPHLDRLIEVATRNVGRMYDSDPTNDPSIEDEALPEVNLEYIQGVLAGREVPRLGVCSRDLADEAQEAVDAIS